LGNFGAGSGYIDVTLDAVEGRLSTKYIEGVLGGKLLIGGGTDTAVSLAGFAVARAGTSTQRAFRLLKTGDYTTYSNKTCALVFDDAAPSPRAQEAVFTQRGVVPHAKNARGFVHCPARMSDGATLQIFLTEIIAQDVTVELYRPKCLRAHWLAASPFQQMPVALHSHQVTHPMCRLGAFSSSLLPHRRHKRRA